MDFQLTIKDKNWIQKKYPKITINEKDSCLSGNINFCLEYNKIQIQDSYTIEIQLIKMPDSILPKTKEVNGKINKIASNLSKPSLDIHINKDDTLCLCIKPREIEYFPNGFNFQTFFEQILEPYLYWVSFYHKYKYPPWDEYAHGYLGYLELYAEDAIKLKDLKKCFDVKNLISISKLKGHSKCLCGQDKKLRNCHPLIYKSTYKLKKVL